MTSFTNFAQTNMSKIDTSPETRFPHLPLLKACFGFGFGFGFGFVGLRRWSENFDWGRMGLVYATVSHRMALVPPGLSIDQFIEKMFCSFVQKIGRSFSFLIEHSTSIRRPSVSEYSLSFTGGRRQ
jgi:hypothetical protein